jgi:hypothetical protein
MRADRRRSDEGHREGKNRWKRVRRKCFLKEETMGIFRRMKLLRDHPDAAPFFIDDRHRFIAMRAFYVDEIVEKADAVVVDQKVELLLADGAGGEIPL